MHIQEREREREREIKRTSSSAFAFLCLHIIIFFVGTPLPKTRFVQQFSSVQEDGYALGKAHMRSTPSLRSFPNFAFETVLVFV